MGKRKKMRKDSERKKLTKRCVCVCVFGGQCADRKR